MDVINGFNTKENDSVSGGNRRISINFGNSDFVYVIFAIFIITEIVDDSLDHLLGSNSILHSIIQLVLFIVLFFTTFRLFSRHYGAKMKKLIPDEVMSILKIVKDAELRGVLVNQKTIANKLNVTKPTLKKRIDVLVGLQYLHFEKEGNQKFLKLTQLGETAIK